MRLSRTGCAEPSTEQQVRLVAKVAAQRAAGLGLERLEAAPDLERLGFGHDADREDAAVAVEGVDLLLGENVGHVGLREEVLR